MLLPRRVAAGAATGVVFPRHVSPQWVMDTSTNPIGRRAFLGSATAVAAVTVTALAAPTADATPLHHADRDRPRPSRGSVPLPDGIRPEGITSGPRTTYYVGSLADGRIVTGDLLAGTSRVLLPGATGRSLRGLRWDRRSGLVWAVGSLGADAHVYAVDPRSGAIASDTVVPGGLFLNDLVVTRDAVWVTDSRVDRLTRIPLRRSGRPAGRPPAYLALTGDWPAGDGKSINANGIRELEDGSLILNNSRVGGLWQVDPRTGRTSAIPVSGGPGIVSGDGLEIDDRTLYDVRGTGRSEVAVLRLSRRDGSWTATWVGALTDPTLDVPSTATLAGGALWAVNARFGVASPGTATYSITRLPVRPAGRREPEED